MSLAQPHRIQCRCGQVQGRLEAPLRTLRALCYCADCQAYARLLGQAHDVLDPLGGTDIVAAPANQVHLTAGSEALACVSLSPRGLLRWRASCCNTPIANTPRSWKLPYVGLVHSCLATGRATASELPPVRMHVNVKSARGATPRTGSLGAMLRFGALILRLNGMRFTGAYRQTPFFDAEGRPVAPVVVLPRAEVEAARAKVAQSAAL